jgi:hypothetical protein
MYVVFTRPANVNGFGFTSHQGCAEITSTRALFSILPETAQVYPTWESLITKYSILGKQAHDTRLVALMIEHRVPRILTFNDVDFRRFNEIQALNPFDVIGIPKIA